MTIIRRGFRIAEGAAILGVAAAIAMTVFGCGGGSTNYNGGTGTTTGGSTTGGSTTGGTTTGGTTTAGTTTGGTTTGGTTGGCAVTYTPNYASTFQSRPWNHMPITVYFNGDLPITTTFSGATNPVSYKQQVLAGFNEWTTALGNKVNYTVVSQQSGADIVVNFQDTPTTGAQVAWTASRSYTNSTLTNATLTFQAQQNGGAVDPAALQLVGAQAFGAALGLGQSPNTADITAAGSTATAPSTSDLNTVKTVYCSYF